MKQGSLRHLLGLSVIVMTIECKKPYNPPAITSPGSYLVVEGVINAGNDSTIIKLSRTVNLSSGTITNPVTGATLAVQSSNSASYALVETAPGSYAVPGLNLDAAQQYRLSIKTADNRQYLSDFVPVILTPPVDSIGFTVNSNGVGLYVNTHDPKNNTRYYRWDYQETWQFHAKYQSAWVSNGKEIVPRINSIYTCFGNNASTTVLLGSSAKLSRDVIYQSPLTQIQSTSEKLETRYSILLRQYALTVDAYNFYLALKKNTEQLGSIFDAQPSQIAGNIHNVINAAEPVIGFVTAVTVQSKRIFISNSQLPNSWLPVYPYECEADTFLYINPKTKQNDVAGLIPIPNGTLPVDAIYTMGNPNPIGFTGADEFCVDCTLRGTTAIPDFWR